MVSNSVLLLGTAIFYIAETFSGSGSILTEVCIWPKYLTLGTVMYSFSLHNLISTCLAHSMTFMRDWSCSVWVLPYISMLSPRATIPGMFSKYSFNFL